MRNRLWALGLTATLAACGGGGGSSTTPPTKDDSVSAAATQTQTALGATDLGTATTKVYDVAADIGDTWRITFNTATNAYVVAVKNTVYGLTNTSTGTSGTYTSTTTGNLTSYVLSGSAGSLSVDTRTKDIAGKMTIGGKSSTVAGTSTAVTDLTKLAGIYNFMGAARNVSNGGSASFVAGQMKINADGVTATICEEGTFNAAGVCDSGNPSSPTVSHSMTLRIDNSDTTMPKIRMEFVTPEYQTEKDFGIVNVQAGDLGAALVIDRFGHNAAGILRTGVFYAAKVQQLTGSNFDGTWKCSQFGVDQASLVLTTTNGSTSNAITDSTGASHTENIYWNKVADASSSTGVTINGFAITVTGSSAVNLLPLSSSIFVAGINNAPMACRKQ